MNCMIESLVVFASLVLLAGCAAQPSVSALCAGVPVTTVTMREQASNPPAAATCTSAFAQSRRGITIGSVQRTSSGSRTVGVPPGFLVAMIILMLLVGLA